MAIGAHLKWFYFAQNWLIGVTLALGGLWWWMGQDHEPGLGAFAIVALGFILLFGQKVCFRFLPASCPACHGASHPRIRISATADFPIAYACDSCGLEHNTNTIYRVPYD